MHRSIDNGHAVVWLGGSVLEVLAAQSDRDYSDCAHQGTYLFIVCVLHTPSQTIYTLFVTIIAVYHSTPPGHCNYSS